MISHENFGWIYPDDFVQIYALDFGLKAERWLQVEQTELLADKFGRRLEETAIDGNSTIFGDPPAHLFAKLIFKISRGGTDQFHMIGKPGERGLARTGMTTLVIVLPDPEIKGDVEIRERTAEKIRQELGTDGAEQTFYLFDLAECTAVYGPGRYPGRRRSVPDARNEKRRRYLHYVPFFVMWRI